jgi:formate hydrogenlyase subunit 6/NADH:ubiquinone oxidoreductase subunit I
MYCGICVEVCPFDALAWHADPIAPESTSGGLLHGTDRLDDGR